MEGQLVLAPFKKKASVFVLYTGGTLGMKPNEDGSLEPAEGYLEDQMSKMQELSHPDMPTWTLEVLEPIMDSSSMGPKDWAKIATELEKRYLDHDGFVVVMGTDTMAYCASALSFIMHNLAKPVIVTGSIIPFASPWNDARRNLIVSLMFATCSDLCEVCISFGGRLLRGNRSRKMSSVDVEAFDSPNFPPLGETSAARFGQNGQVALNKYLLLKHPRGRLMIHREVQSNILVVKINPVCQFTALRLVVESAKALRALVLELYGNGKSSYKGALAEIITAAVKKGLIVVAATQCAKGLVNVDAHSIGREMISLGAISAKDMTTEAVVTKLGVLIGCGYGDEKVRDLMSRSLCGEMTPDTSQSLSKL
jgi:L-asparaginase